MAVSFLLAFDRPALAYTFGEPFVKAIGPEETVFDWTTDACQADDIPDVPGRAFRDSRGRTQLIVSHWNTRRELSPVGGTLNDVAHDCNVVFFSDNDPDASDYNYQEWIHSLYTLDGKTVYGFVHQEYHGWDFYPECEALIGTPDLRKCWYNGVTFATSTNDGDSYTQAPSPNHLLASVPYQFVPLQGPSGVYRPTNILAGADSYYYMMVLIEPVGAQKRGICLMRTQSIHDPTTWRAWDGAGFSVRFMNPYVETAENPANHVCEPVSPQALQGLDLYSVTYSTYLQKYVLLGAAIKDPAKQIGGFYFSLSDDLVNWSEPALLMEAEFAGTHQCGEPNPVRDASLLDPATPASDRNFEKIGRRPYLYLTRFNYFYTGSGGCSLTLDRDLIRIPIEFTAPNQLPTASFAASPNPALTGQVVTFNGTASSDPGGTITKYEWDLDGNGSFETNTNSTPTTTRTYPTAATVAVKLRVTDNGGATNDTTRTLLINQPPTASFTVSPNPALVGQVVTFNGSASSDPGGTITKYEWDLDGNGSFETNTGAAATTTRSYPAAATVTVKLRVTDNNGAANEMTRSLTVNPSANQPPTASFTVAPNPAATGQTVTFNGTASSDPDGTIANYKWDLDGNGTFETDTGAAATATRSYPSAATVAVKLRVTDNGGASGDTTRTLTVSNRAPTASFTVSPNPALTNQAVTFNGSASSDPDGTIANYKWDLDGNGSFETDTGIAATVTRTYATATAATVALRVTDSNGATNDTTRSLTVHAAPVASFTVIPNPALVGQVVTFDGSASSDPDGTIAKYVWDLDGNGSFETDTGATTTTMSSYSTASTVVAKLRVTDNDGTTNGATHTLTVNQAPESPIVGPPQPVLPPVAPSGQPSPKPVTCTSARQRRTRLVRKRRAARRKLARAHSARARRHYKRQIRSLNRLLKRLSSAPCS